jgi:hypothetical protein
MSVLRRFFGTIWPDCRGMVIRFGVESLSGLLWNPYPLSRGIAIQFVVEYTLKRKNEIINILLISITYVTAYVS